MMAKKIMLLSFVLVQLNVSAQSTFPSFEQVVTTFFSNYDLRTEQGADDIRFLKREKGFFIEEYDAKKEAYRLPILFWSASENAYLKLGFPENSDADTDHIKDFLSYYNNELFNTLPYYGYTGWPKDVITLLEGKTDLTDTEYYALGRAYSSRASHLLNSSSKFADSTEQFDFKESGKNQFSSQQLKTYTGFVDKALSNFTKLCEKNPDYPTIVGGICNKLHNEYVSTFLNLRIYQNEAEAIEFLPEGLYSDFFMDYAKNYLNSVAPNAILFTTGDNDTYPFLYAQAKLQHRQDVLIVNTSLLNQNSYVNHLRNDTRFGSPPIQFALLPETYTKEKLDVIIVKSENIPDEHIPLKDILKLFNSNDPSTIYEAYPNYSILPSNRIAIAIDDKVTLALDYDVQYILQGELLALDIVQSNIGNRPIYCTFNELPIVSDYLEQDGFAYRLTAEPQNKIADIFYLGGIDADRTYSLLMDNFEFSKNTEKHLGTRVSVLLGYASSFNVLAKHYQSVGDVKKCEDVLAGFLDFYPKDIYLRTYFLVLNMAETAYASHLVAKGDEILDYLLKNIAYEQKVHENGARLTLTQLLRQKIFGEETGNRINQEKLEEYLDIIYQIKDMDISNTDIKNRVAALERYCLSEYNKL